MKMIIALLMMTSVAGASCWTHQSTPCIPDVVLSDRPLPNGVWERCPTAPDLWCRIMTKDSLEGRKAIEKEGCEGTNAIQCPPLGISGPVPTIPCSDTIIQCLKAQIPKESYTLVLRDKRGVTMLVRGITDAYNGGKATPQHTCEVMARDLKDSPDIESVDCFK